MRGQLSVENKEGQVLAGSFPTLQFEGSLASSTFSLPPSALIVGKNGVQVATVDGAATVQLNKATVARDHGTCHKLADGVTQSDQVIANPADGLSSGDQVRIAIADAATAK
ncbi:hypothetical protein BW687_001675 [Pseudomonas graminis]|uniref:hypothetical protein n=1 Tax=Pseudomonas graminis TaxID=158627 RepID=UPI0023494224|nr:hypothetical protein [Pseudomonas graminis]MDC6378887.1 hypothetical protein [Pseudomonas graminis]